MQWKVIRIPIIHILLLGLTLFTTLLAGAELVSGQSWMTGLSWDGLAQGWAYSLSFLLFLTSHEFGHYLAARFHKVRTTLPFYIPLYIPIPGMLNIGSFGAVIALQEMPDNSRKFFDIGIAGPLAGFVVSLGLLLYGFTHLPDPDTYILKIHPEYQVMYGGVPDEATLSAHLTAMQSPGLLIGESLLYQGLQTLLVSDPSRIPPRFEVMHYPFLFVGFLTLFFTALNLLPIGQLDGGHVIYGLLGPDTALQVSRGAVVMLLLLGGTGLVYLPATLDWDVGIQAAYLALLIYASIVVAGRQLLPGLVLAGVLLGVQVGCRVLFPAIEAHPIWLVYCFMAVRIIRLPHPRTRDDRPVRGLRAVLGWLAVLIFVLCFTPSPISIIGG
ncbi:MAG: site-2 protease family protein [Bacteroidia bacterium]|nr:site-2 protease family protein [Bacteroidia bacterium]